MAVTLDAPAQTGIVSHGPIWRVDCCLCPDRLYLVADDAEHAEERAVTEFGWHSGDVCYREEVMQGTGSVTP